MELRRRRTDSLASLALPEEPHERADAACQQLEACGFDVAFAVQLSAGRRAPSIRAGFGHFEPLIEVGKDLADRAAHSERAMESVTCNDPRTGERWQLTAIACGWVRKRPVVVVVADRRLARRESEAIAAWMAAPQCATDTPPGGACGPLAKLLVQSNRADVAVLALFTQSGMLLNMHARNGGLLRAWRVPGDTIWGEAARHGAAFVIGDLPMHPGAESLASLGMQTAAVVGLENGSGVAVGSVGLGAFDQLDTDIAHRLLEQAPLLGPKIMQLRSRTPVPAPDQHGAVELNGFAARVGCRRFAMYSRTGNVLRLVSAHGNDGRVVSTPPDPYEEQLVCWAAEKGVAVASDTAAAVVVGDDTVLYAHDPTKQAIDCLRLALQDLRHNPYGDQHAA